MEEVNNVKPLEDFQINDIVQWKKGDYHIVAKVIGKRQGVYENVKCFIIFSDCCDNEYPADEIHYFDGGGRWDPAPKKYTSPLWKVMNE
jgi:hypothetical protein